MTSAAVNRTTHGSKIPTVVIIVAVAISLVIAVGLVSVRVSVVVRRRKGASRKRTLEGETETLLQEFVGDLDTDDWTGPRAVEVLENYHGSNEGGYGLEAAQQAAMYILARTTQDQKLALAESTLDEQSPSDLSHPSQTRRAPQTRRKQVCVVCGGKPRSRHVRCVALARQLLTSAQILCILLHWSS